MHHIRHGRPRWAGGVVAPNARGCRRRTRPRNPPLPRHECCVADVHARRAVGRNRQTAPRRRWGDVELAGARPPSTHR
eukprot:11178635-Lingulodinium_polyedra.AAC.1